MVFSNLKSTETISSDLVRVCFCHNDKLNCSYQPPPIKIRKEEAFKVSLAAVDHVTKEDSNQISAMYLPDWISIPDPGGNKMCL